MKKSFGATLVTLTLGAGWAIALTGTSPAAPAAVSAATTHPWPRAHGWRSNSFGSVSRR
jgi:hypothetical protein